jgi:hypothetical protein
MTAALGAVYPDSSPDDAGRGAGPRTDWVNGTSIRAETMVRRLAMSHEQNAMARRTGTRCAEMGRQVPFSRLTWSLRCARSRRHLYRADASPVLYPGHRYTEIHGAPRVQIREFWGSREWRAGGDNL